MSQRNNSNWFNTRDRFDAGAYRLDEVWKPLLYAIDVSCGNWRVALMVRRIFERNGQAAFLHLSGLAQVEAIAEALSRAYLKACEELGLLPPDIGLRRDQIRSALEMVWQLPEDWQPQVSQAEPAGPSDENARSFEKTTV